MQGIIRKKSSKVGAKTKVEDIANDTGRMPCCDIERPTPTKENSYTVKGLPFLLGFQEIIAIIAKKLGHLQPGTVGRNEQDTDAEDVELQYIRNITIFRLMECDNIQDSGDN